MTDPDAGQIGPPAGSGAADGRKPEVARVAGAAPVHQGEAGTGDPGLRAEAGGRAGLRDPAFHRGEPGSVAEADARAAGDGAKGETAAVAPRTDGAPAAARGSETAVATASGAAGSPSAAGDGLFGGDQALSEMAPGEARASVRGGPATGPLPIFQAPDTPRLVALQIAEVVRASGERAVELRLQPEELGRVQLTMSQDATGTLTVALNVERADTLELLRRNIDLLGADLRDLGYESIDFTFQGDGAPGEEARNGRDDPAPAHDTDIAPGGDGTTRPRTGRPGAGGDGIDLRL